MATRWGSVSNTRIGYKATLEFKLQHSIALERDAYPKGDREAKRVSLGHRGRNETTPECQALQ